MRDTLDKIIQLTKNYIETLISLHVTVVENTEESVEEFFKLLAPSMSGTSYSPSSILKYFNTVPEKVIFDVEDCFFLKWAVIKIPSKHPEQYENDFLVIGPYFTSNPPENLTQKALLRNNLQTAYTSPLKMFYHSVPICSSSKVITSMRSFLEQVYDITSEPECRTVYPFGSNTKVDPTDYFVEEESIYMAQSERRYALESRMQVDVAQGNSVGAMQTWRILRVEMENVRRIKDTLRNAKNNCIIHNTILRKAAEKAYVHPLYIESLSNQIISAIEESNSVEELHKMQEAFITEYCKLVSKHSLVKYTPMVRQALNYINTHLSSDIHLPEIATAINVSPNYLSAVFNRETKQSISTYINKKRVDKAIELLETSNSSIEDVASFVGFSDMNYFTRVFKGIKGMTPSDFRKHTVIVK